MQLKVGCALLALVSLSCAPMRPPLYCVAAEGQTRSLYYVDGIPVATYTTDCAAISVAMQPIVMNQLPYLQTSIQISNLASRPIDMDPGTCISLDVVSTENRVTLYPTPPYVVLGRIKQEKDMSILARHISGALETLGTQPTQVSSSGGQSIAIHDEDYKRARARAAVLADVAAIGISADAMRIRIDSSLLRRNTIFPGNSVAGTVYFDLPFGMSRASRLSEVELQKHDYHLVVHVPCDSSETIFKLKRGDWGAHN